VPLLLQLEKEVEDEVLLISGQNAEECDATEADQGDAAGKTTVYPQYISHFTFLIFPLPPYLCGLKSNLLYKLFVWQMLAK
jgi:hypothetical protein